MSQQNNSLSSTSSSPLTTQSSFNKDEVEEQVTQWKNKLKTFICPISQQLMIDPVMIETGQTYDRKEIEEWLQKQNTCPTTGIKLKSKTLTPNYIAKSAINENIEKFVKKVIKHVKKWSTDVNLFEICLELIKESLDLIKSLDSFKNYQNELNNLKFNILLNELNEDKLFNNYFNALNELQDLQFKLSKLQLLENKLINEKYLKKYYNELLNLLIELNNKENDNLIIEMFTKYCKFNNLDNNLIDDIFSHLEFDEVKLDYLIILFNESNYNRNYLLQKLLNVEIDENNNKFIPFFKNLFKEINLNEIDLEELIEFITDYKNELQDELIIIYKELYKNSNELKYLEIIYDLNMNDKEIETLLMNEYLNLNLMDKYLNLFIKTNENKLDSFNLMLLKCLQNQNNKIEKLIIENNFLQNENLELKNKFNNFKDSLLYSNNLKEWKNQQIISNFKIKYPEYDYVNIVNIKTPLNVKKEEYFYSNVFGVFGLKWKIEIDPKGDSKSKENECAIYLYLNSLQYKNENEKEKEISSINIKFIIDSIYLNDNDDFEFNFTKIKGYGNVHFKQCNFIPIIKNDQQIFSVVIGMKKPDIEFK
ncbi:hypothetical protein ABK040_011414 [Willaertia magna]